MTETVAPESGIHLVALCLLVLLFVELTSVNVVSLCSSLDSSSVSFRLLLIGKRGQMMKREGGIFAQMAENYR